MVPQLTSSHTFSNGVHHADVSQALLLAVDSPTGNGRIYNVADDEPVVAGELLHFFGQPIPADATQRNAH